MLNAFRRFFADWSWFERLWIVLFTAISLYLYVVLDDTLIGLITTFTGMMCVVLGAKAKIENYYFGIVNVVLYAFISYQNQYYGELMLNALYFLPMNFYGWYVWSKNQQNNDGTEEIQVQKLSLVIRLIGIILIAITIAIYGYLLTNLDGSRPYLDASSTVMSIAAMYLMAKRYVEQWIVWLAVNTITILLWYYAVMQDGQNQSMLVMWIAYWINSVYGYIHWLKLYKSQHS